MTPPAITEELFCPVCEYGNLRQALEVSRVPVLCNELLNTREAAQQVVRGDISLYFCPRCGHWFNAKFDPTCLEYDSAYENSLHHSSTFSDWSEALVQRLFERFSLKAGTVVEIGCGSGEFLAALHRLGVAGTIGFDPGATALVGREGGPELHDRPFIEHDFATAVLLIVCRHVLEHLHRPAELLQAIRRKPKLNEAAVYFEVPNASFVINRGSVWDIIYEHCHYFSARSLAWLFYDNGFSVEKVCDSFHGQYLSLEGLAMGDGAQYLPEAPSDVDLKSLFQHRKKQGEDLLSARRNRVSVLWGAGSKGVSLLNTLEGAAGIELVVDLNPLKHNKYIPGSGHLVVGPEVLRQIQPQVVWLSNPAYREEIREKLHSMGMNPELLAL